MSVLCARAAAVSLASVRSALQPLATRCALVSSIAFASSTPVATGAGFGRTVLASAGAAKAAAVTSGTATSAAAATVRRKIEVTSVALSDGCGWLRRSYRGRSHPAVAAEPPRNTGQPISTPTCAPLSRCRAESLGHVPESSAQGWRDDPAGIRTVEVQQSTTNIHLWRASHEQSDPAPSRSLDRRRLYGSRPS